MNEALMKFHSTIAQNGGTNTQTRVIRNEATNEKFTAILIYLNVGWR